MLSFLMVMPNLPLLVAAFLVLAWTAWAQTAGGLATARAPTLLEVDGSVWQLFGIRGLAPNAICARGGAPFACGEQVMNMLNGFIAGRRVTCERRERPETDTAQGVCSTAGEDIAAWLVRNGWAFADTSVSVNYLVDEGYAKMQRAGLWQPETTVPER